MTQEERLEEAKKIAKKHGYTIKASGPKGAKMYIITNKRKPLFPFMLPDLDGVLRLVEDGRIFSI